jgi:GntR family transcriptional regulator, vanillate catabolism transcriptional regulator
MDGSPERLVDRITKDLRELILDNKIPPGAVLIQTEWAEKLQVSRTPLREAFRILEQDGLVQVSNGNRTIQVVQFSDRELRDLYEVREVIDGLAARLLAVKGLEPDTDAGLADLLATMDSAADPFDSATWFSAHMAFHLRIAQACGNARVRQQESLIKMTSFSLHSYIAGLPPGSERLETILEVASRQHRSIYDALRAGSGDLAEMAACGHIRTTLKSDLIAGATVRAGDAPGAGDGPS